MHHYLEFKDDKSSKFWEITSFEKSFTVRYGKIGTNGQTQTKEFSSVEEAEKAAEIILKEKLNKGYIEKGSSKTDWPVPTQDSGNNAVDLTKRLIDAIETFRKYPGIDAELSLGKFEPLNRSDLPSMLDDIRGDLGFDLPKDLRENFINGEQISFKWDSSGIKGQMNLCGTSYSLIFKRLKDIGHEYLYDFQPAELVDSLFYVDGNARNNDMVLVSAAEGCNKSMMYLLTDDPEDLLQEMDISWAEYLNYATMFLGLEGWQRLFTSGFDDDETKNFRKGLDLLAKVFPQNDMSGIMKLL
jgi:predicted DNA-binding WGR domain protein